MSDALACERRCRLFNVADDFNRKTLHIEVETSINSKRLVRNIERLRKDMRQAEVQAALSVRPWSM